MVKCSSCAYQHPDGTLFCSQCGALLSGDVLHTKPLVTPEKAAPSAEPRAPSVGSAEAEAPSALTILIKSSARQLSPPSRDEYILGRADATRDIFPDIDLTPDGGFEGGVSRRHARIYKQRGQLVVEDLGSANGTFLNGQRLTPYLPYPLCDKDEVQLGLVRLQVYL
ncbi:MAG: FHA domain-containing protein [Thermoflexales bacterium]|nr:FHA domain-containing protein [Thermoflexales bacterium]